SDQSAIVERNEAVFIARIPSIDIVIKGSELVELVSTFVVRLQFASSKWPAAIRNPITLLKIFFIQWATSTGPQICGAAEIAHAPKIQLNLDRPCVLPLVQ